MVLLKILLATLRLLTVKLFVSLFLLFPIISAGQIFTEDSLITRLVTGGSMPAELLSSRSVVLHSHSLTAKEMALVHENFVRTGIDAIVYFATDAVLAGGDVANAYAQYFARREILNLIIVEKSSSGFGIYITTFNGKEDFVNVNQIGWHVQNPSLYEALTTIYRTALASNKKKNFLINEFPEINLPVRILTGQRYETFAYDLKADKLAIPNFNDTTLDNELKEFFKGYPFRHEIVNHTIPDKELRNKGFLYVLCFIHTRSSTAKELLDYGISKSESAFVSVTHPNGQVQLKNIPADSLVFKYYVRHIDSGNVYLGTQWDADTTWQQALQNFIKGFKTELKIN